MLDRQPPTEIHWIMMRKLVFTAVLFVVFLSLIEGGARVLETQLHVAPTPDGSAGWQTGFFASLFDWHEPDPDLLWRFKANLDNSLITTNSVNLIGSEVTADKPPNSYRILLLGDSSPVGLGLKSRDETFAVLTEKLLKVALAGHKEIELLNCAVSGYSSEQIRAFMELRGWEYAPDLVVVYCGNNDASVSGPLSDRELMDLQQLTTIRRILGGLACYRLVREVLTSGETLAQSPSTELKVRVSPKQYEQNLAEIAKQCRLRGCDLILLKPPVPRMWPAGLQFKLFTHLTGEDGQVMLPERMSDLLGRKLKYCLDHNQFKQLYGEGDLFTRGVYSSAYNDSLSFVEAIARYRAEMQTDPLDPVPVNNLGVSYWQEGEYATADSLLRLARHIYSTIQTEQTPAVIASGSPFLYNIGVNLKSMESLSTDGPDSAAGLSDLYLDSALQADFFSLRVKRAYWESIDQLGTGSQVTVLDLDRVFAANGGETLFVDHCHPTVEGHRLVALELAAVVVALQR